MHHPGKPVPGEQRLDGGTIGQIDPLERNRASPRRMSRRAAFSAGS